MFKKVSLGILTVATAMSVLYGCGGGSAESDGTAMGTGYLKAQLPAVPAGAGAALMRAMSPATNFDAFDQALAAGDFLESKNTKEACIGTSGNIPFVLCMIESLGIDQPGTYSGEAPSGKKVSVVVGAIDDEDYDLQAVATLTGTSKVVFEYKASADGSIGIVTYDPYEIFGGAGEANYRSRTRLVWDARQNTAQTFAVTSQFYIDDVASGVKGPASNIMKVAGVVNSITNVADLGMKQAEKVMTLQRVSVAQARIGANLAILIPAKCVSESATGLDDGCFVPDAADVDQDWTDHVDGTSFAATCGTIADRILGVVDAAALSNNWGALAFTNTDYSDAACETLGSGLTVGIDDVSTAPPHMEKTVHQSFADMTLYPVP